MSVKIEASEGGRPHNEILGIGLIGSLVCIYLTYLNVLTGTEIFSFFGGLGAVLALVWGTDTIKHLCSYGLGTGVPSAGMIALGSGVIAMLFATKFGIAAPVAALIIAALLGAVIGYVSDKVVNMNIPVMVVSLIELAVVGALTIMGLAAMAGGSFMFADLVTGTTTVFGISIASYGSSVIGGSVLAVVFMLGGIAVQHAFNACLGPGEQQDRTLMLAAECGFLSMIGIAVISFAFISFGSAVVALLVSIIGWYYTYTEYIKLSRRDAYDWLDAKPIHEPKGGA
ncbi:MAG: tetrahydromethanopterin S-methyltransferase subunit C [Methanoculleus sp. SDB]|nr:MAG: tetrahydromethanopterin S-methyltransferase subunit C [Methanoculleus sp. SDB]